MGNNSAISDSATFTVEEYLTEREMSSLPVLLVEGSDDSIFFQLIKDVLVQELAQNESHSLESLSSIEIDTSEIIKSPEGRVLGNREKVEYVCRIASDFNFKGLLLGFVDREFREFDLDEHIQDRLGTHNKIDQVVWSRGHSIENYFFEFNTLRDGLRDFGINSRYPIQSAIQLFELNFDKVVGIVCSVSLAANKNNLIKVVESSSNPSVFEFDGDEIKFSLDTWNTCLSRKMGLDEVRRNSLIESFNLYSGIASNSDIQTLRWLCHGHIGMNFIWSAFEACIIRKWDTIGVTQNDRKIRSVSSKDRFIKFSLKWIEQQMEMADKLQNMPLQCFRILGSRLK